MCVCEKMILQKNEVGKNKDREREREFAKCIVRPQKGKLIQLLHIMLKLYFRLWCFLTCMSYVSALFSKYMQIAF